MGRKFESLLPEYSAQRMSVYCRGLNFTIEELSPQDGKIEIHGEEISLILISGNSGSIILKAHFNLETARCLAAHAYEKQPEQVSDEIAREFLKEYSNLKAGTLRGAFEKNGILLGMSLPFLVPGEDELYFQKTKSKRARQIEWRLTSDLGSLVCTLEIALDQREADKLAQTVQDIVDQDKRTAADTAASAGQFEFL